MTLYAKTLRLIVLLISFVLTACASEPSALTVYTQPEPQIERSAIDASSISSAIWTTEEIEILLSLWIGSLPSIPPDPTNPVADNPQAAALGHRLFFDEKLSANNQIACATCHIPARYFTDGLPTAHGTRSNPKNTPTIVGSGYAPWLFWNGRSDSLWAQAVTPFEAPDEHGSTRLHAVHRITDDPDYRAQYEMVFGSLPDGIDDYGRFPAYGGPVDYPDYRDRWEQMSPEDQEIATQIFVNLGKAIAAYEQLLNPASSSFDAYVEALIRDDQDAMDAAMDEDAIAGLQLFIGKANCIQCHHGPLFSDFEFHNTGVPSAPGQNPAEGRALGWELALNDEFNCKSDYSEGTDRLCAEKLTPIASTTHWVGAFRTPMLRNSTTTSPYMHAGQLHTLTQVLAHYNEAPMAALGVSELQSLDLSEDEQKQLIAFLHTLASPINAPDVLLEAP